MIRRPLARLAIAALIPLAACAYPYTPPALSPVTRPAPASTRSTAQTHAPVTILVSIDGFRPDYLDRGVTPNLSRLVSEGMSAAMRPSFPSKTFPNHWAIVTGVRPDRSGIVANTMEDPARPGETFTMATDDPFWWNAAEPIWVTAERAGVRTATMFWPGASVAWGGTRAGEWPHDVAGGVRPNDWWPYGQAVSGAGRVRGVLDWLRRPPATRPRFVTLYFDTVDTAGHRFGPDDPRTTQAVASALLRPHAHMTCWRRPGPSGVEGERIPARFHYGANSRVPPFLCLARDGWTLAKTAPAKPEAGGNHGYDNDLPDMRALFIANGPAFAVGKRLATFDSVDIAPLLRDLLGLPAGAGLDGTDEPFRGVMTTPGR